MANNGFTPTQALHAATLSAAELMGYKHFSRIPKKPLAEQTPPDVAAKIERAIDQSLFPKKPRKERVTVAVVDYSKGEVR